LENLAHHKLINDREAACGCLY